MIHNREISQFKGDLRPVDSISWHEAQTFIFLMNVFGRRHYRLPSEAEWEYAARAGTTTAYYWGDRAEDGCEHENIADLSLKKARPDSVVANCDDHQLYTAPIGSYKPNPWGLYDVLGNVAEWVEDCSIDYEEAPKDGGAYTAENCSDRLIRGGSWSSNPRALRAAKRGASTMDVRYYDLGFRVARTVTPCKDKRVISGSSLSRASTLRTVPPPRSPRRVRYAARFAPYPHPRIRFGSFRRAARR
jgi:formylglycine-generating enzyme required for sulfatase activity